MATSTIKKESLVLSTDVYLTNINLGSNGYYEFTTGVPSNGYAISCMLLEWSNISSPPIWVTPYKNGKGYVLGERNSTVSSLSIRTFYTV